MNDHSAAREIYAWNRESPGLAPDPSTETSIQPEASRAGFWEGWSFRPNHRRVGCKSNRATARRDSPAVAIRQIGAAILPTSET